MSGRRAPFASLRHDGRLTRLGRLVTAGLSALALAAGLVAAPAVGFGETDRAQADEVVEFPEPSHYIDPSYQDVTGTHVTSTEPTISISSWDEEEPEGGYPEYSVDLEIAATETSTPLARASLETVRDGGSSDASWTAPEALFEFDEAYVLRYRLTSGGEQGDWIGWAPFFVTAPSAAPSLLSPAAGALSTNPVELVAQVPGYTPTPDAYDSVIFTVQEAWQNGEPLTVAQLWGEIGPDGIARTTFSTYVAAGQYRWNAQWVGAGFSEPSEFRELTISRAAPPVQYVYVTPDRTSAIVHWQVNSPQFAPVEYVDVTLSPGGATHRVPTTSASTTFTDLPLGDYTATITATNALGTSTPVVTPFTVVATSPSAPTDLAAVVTDGGTRAHVSWNPPTNDGGAPVTEYYVIVRSFDGGQETSFYTSELSADIDVETGFTYLIYVYSGNEVSLGDLAAVRLEVFGVPSAPRNLEVRPGDGFVNIYWDIPENIGGKWPTKYRVNVQGVGVFVVTAYYARMGIQLNDLENGHPYKVTIRAINEIGAGAVATLTGVTPVASDADADADGLPDVVETRFGTSSALADTDNDGLADVDETLKLSAFLSPTIADTDDDGVLDSDEDSDEDGITNADELAGGTNPGSPDSDRDSLEDAAEVAAGTDPLQEDTDSDGVQDATELASGLNPASADSDGDGTGDADTVAAQTIRDEIQYEPQTTEFREPQVHIASELSGVSAAITGPAGRLDDIAVSSSPTDDLVGAVTTAAIIIDDGALEDEVEAQGPVAMSMRSPAATTAGPAVSQLTFGYAANVSSDRLQDLAPVRWNPVTYTWEFADNDVSLSTATRTITILSPELGLKYAVVDLRSWRAHVTECNNGSTGRPQLDVQFVIDAMPSVVLGDSTNERFTAALTVLNSLQPGDTASVREFGLIGTVYSGGSGSAPGSWDFANYLQSSLTPEDLFGLDSRERARLELTTLSQQWGPEDAYLFPHGEVGWEPELVLSASLPGAADGNPYSPNVSPLQCRKNVVVLVTDGETDGELYGGTWDGEDTFAESGVPVHVLDIGIGDPESSEWLAQLAEDTDGTYSYVPTAGDLSGWIEDVAPIDYHLGNPTKDTDGDTIPDAVETYGIAGTMNGVGQRFYSNPRKADSDGDLIPDNIEIGQRLVNGTQGAAWTAATINRNYSVISDPGSKDGDSDGLDDRAEIDANMNPLSGDGDGDGLIDGIEEQYGTFAQMYDTDSDGFNDAYEVYHEKEGYDPRAYNERVSEFEWLSEAAIGFFCGEVDICSMTTIPWLVGNIASGLLIFGDLRDGIALIVKGDYVSAAFCAVGLIPAVGDVIGTVAKIAKFVKKIFFPLGFANVATVTGPGAPASPDRITSAAGVGSAASAAINGAQAIKMLAQYAKTPKKFVEELIKIDPAMVTKLRASKLSDKAITDLVTKNGFDRIKAYTDLPSSKVRIYAYTDETLPKLFKTGKAGEAALLKLIGLAPDFKQIRDTVRVLDPVTGQYVDKIRYWDAKYTLDEITHYFEAKVGYVASGFSYAQLAKDIARLNAPGTKGVFEWHFYASSVNGKIGPSLPMLQALTDAGIKVVFHFPGGAV